jgi:hypothetical protein
MQIWGLPGHSGLLAGKKSLLGEGPEAYTGETPAPPTLLPPAHFSGAHLQIMSASPGWQEFYGIGNLICQK